MRFKYKDQNWCLYKTVTAAASASTAIRSLVWRDGDTEKSLQYRPLRAVMFFNTEKLWSCLGFYEQHFYTFWEYYYYVLPTVFPLCWITLSMIWNHILDICHLYGPSESFILGKSSMFSHERNVIKILYKTSTLDRSTGYYDWYYSTLKRKTGNFMWNQGTAHRFMYAFVISCSTKILIKNTLHYLKHKIAASSAFRMLFHINIIIIILLS